MRTATLVLSIAVTAVVVASLALSSFILLMPALVFTAWFTFVNRNRVFSKGLLGRLHLILLLSLTGSTILFYSEQRIAALHEPNTQPIQAAGPRFLFDEVQPNVGRTGNRWEYLVVPDVLLLAWAATAVCILEKPKLKRPGV